MLSIQHPPMIIFGDYDLFPGVTQGKPRQGGYLKKTNIAFHNAMFV